MENEWADFAHKVQLLMAAVFKVPLEVITGRQEPKNDPKQEGDA